MRLLSTRGLHQDDWGSTKLVRLLDNRYGSTGSIGDSQDQLRLYRDGRSSTGVTWVSDRVVGLLVTGRVTEGPLKILRWLKALHRDW